MFVPGEMNWASNRMYDTHKRAILYALCGLILGVCGLLHPLAQTMGTIGNYLDSVSQPCGLARGQMFNF